MIAVEWIVAMPSSADAAHRAHQLRRHRELVADRRTRIELEDAGLVTLEHHIEHQLVARLDRALEACAVDADEVVDGLVVDRLVQCRERQQRRRLRQRLEHQHAGHHRPMRKVTLEERLVDRDILDCLDALAGFHLEHPIDEQDRVAMRQLFQNLVNVHHGVFFSSARTRSRKACSWRKVAAFFSQAELSSMGNTPVYCPGLRIDRVAADPIETITWSASVIWPRIIAAPPIWQCAPIVVLPATAEQPAITVCAPMCTLWAIWIRLSSFTPSSMTVSSSAPRSMQVLAPISTSSPMRTAPSCSIFSQRPCVGAKPKPSAPITTPLWTMPRSPMRQPLPSTTCGASRVAAPTIASAPMRQLAPMTAASPIRAPASMTASAPTVTPAPCTSDD